MASKESYADLVAAFKAKGGKVTVVPEGEGLNRTEKEWSTMIREPRGPAESRRQRLSAEQESEIYVQRVREENGYYKS